MIGKRVTVNHPRYEGRQGTIVEACPNGQMVVKLDHWAKELGETPDGMIWLFEDQYEVVDLSAFYFAEASPLDDH